MSATVRQIGPPRSRENDSGMMPARLTRPWVATMPTSAFAAAGLRTDPAVSVPSAQIARFAATAAPEPALEPPGTRFVS